MPVKRQDITGLRYGKLTAIEPFACINAQWHWRYRCDCGVEITRAAASVTASAKRLSRPSCKSCREAPRVSKEDISGNRYGKLVAISPVNDCAGGFWIFRCDCGNEERRHSYRIKSYAKQGGTSMCKPCDNLRKKKKTPDLYEAGDKYSWADNLRKRVCHDKPWRI